MSKTDHINPEFKEDPFDRRSKEKLEQCFSVGPIADETEFTYPKQGYVSYDGNSVNTHSIIDPTKCIDPRLIKYYNIPALLKQDQTGVNADGMGMPTGNVTIKEMLKFYLDGMEESNNFLNKLKYSSVDVMDKMNKLSENFVKKCESGELRKDIELLASKTGLDFKSATEAYSELIMSEQMIRLISKEVKDKDKWYNHIFNKLIKSQSPISELLLSGGIRKVLNFFNCQMSSNIGTALFPGVGTVVGGVVGFAVAIGLSFVTKIDIAVNKCSDFCSKMDILRKQEEQIIDFAYTYLIQERALNYAMLMKQMLHYFLHEENKVLDSNVFVVAIDHRNYFDPNELKKKHNYKMAQKMIEIPNYGSWCDFKYIEGLKNAPKAREYRGKDKQYIENLIRIFKAASNPNEEIDFLYLKRVLIENKELPVNIIVVSNTVSKMIEDFISLEMTDDKIISYMRKNQPSIPIEKIREIINEKRKCGLQKYVQYRMASSN